MYGDSFSLSHLIKQEDLLERLDTVEFYRRLIRIKGPGPWEGLTWILDLLPDNPHEALKVLDAYFLAHMQILPDGRIDGLSDAETIIRQRYLHFKNSRESLLNLTPFEFELLISWLWEKMGHSISITQGSYDGGIDIVATNKTKGRSAHILIQCKRYKENIGASVIRELTGVVSRHHANKGVVITTAGFTRQARKEAGFTPIIEIIDFDALNIILNKYLGPRWPTYMHYRVREIQSRLGGRAIG